MSRTPNVTNTGIVPERGMRATRSWRCEVRTFAWRPASSFFSSCSKGYMRSRRPILRGTRSRIVSMSQDGLSDEVEAATKKYGLEGGLWNIMTSKDDGSTDGVEPKLGKGAQAKELLKRYGSAYLITSITLSLISF
eukprot:2381947-Pyramimonas_sp.AAC.1